MVLIPAREENLTGQQQNPIYATSAGNVPTDLFSDSAESVLAPVSPSVPVQVHTPQEARDAADVPAPFATIAGQLTDPILSKLKTVDIGTATVVFAVAGRKSVTQPLGFMAVGDFAENCVEELGCGGRIRVSITHKEAGKKSETFNFGFRASGDELPELSESDKMIAAMREMQADNDKKLEKLRVDMLLQGGGGKQPDQFEMFEKSLLLAEKIRGPQVQQPAVPQQSLTEQMTGMVNVFKGVAEVQSELTTVAGVIAPVAEKTTTESLNEFAASPLGNDVRDMVKFVMKRKFNKGSGGGDSPRLATKPTAPSEDLFGAA